MNTESMQKAMISMPVVTGISCLLVLFACGCAPVHETISHDDVPVRTYKQTSDPDKPRTYRATCQQLSDFEFDCGFEVESTCRVRDVEVVDRTRVIKRTTSTTVKVVEWLAASAALASGVGVTADAPNVYGSNDPRGTNSVGKAGAYGIGISLTVAGAGLLALAITDSARALDRREHVGEVEIAGISASVPCARQPAAGLRVAAEVRGRRIEVGGISAEGHLLIDVRQVLTADYVTDVNTSPVMTVLIDDQRLGTIPLAAYRRLVFEDRLAKARASRDLSERMRYFAESSGAYKILGESEDLKALAVETAAEIEGVCKNTTEVPKLAAWLKQVEMIVQTIPEDSAEKLRLSLDSRRNEIEERIRVQEERRVQAEEARLAAWSKRHIPSAKKAARSYLLDNLVVPSTARILKTKVLENDGNSYVIYFVVDAQNAFGVYMRNKYCVSIELEMDKPGRYVPGGMEECDGQTDY